MSESAARSPFLFDVRIDDACAASGCTRKAVRVVVTVDDADDPDCNEITLGFYCDAHAEAVHAAMLLPARGVA